MLTSSLQIATTGVNLSLSIDGPHSFSIEGWGSYSDLPAIGSQITIYRSGTAYFLGKITNTNCDETGKISISGQDVSSYWAQTTTVDDAEFSENTLSNLSTVSAEISNLISVPALTCYGFGSFSGTIESYVNRIANNFGLHYIYNLLSQGVTLSSDVVEPGSTSTNVPALSFDTGSSYNNSISKIFLQKTVEIPESISATISNGSSTETFTSPLHNSLQSATSAYPIDVFIDPGSWEQVRLQTTTTVTTYQEKIALDNAVQVKIEEWNDTTADPRWRLFLYHDDTFLVDFLSGTWNADDTAANYAVIARYKADTTPAEIEYPDFNGLACKITYWQTTPSNISSWENSALSGDSGREDTNIIDEIMFPSFASLDSERIAKRDSNPNSSSITTFGTDIGELTLPETTYSNLSSATSEFPKVQVPLVAMELTEQGNTSETTLVGEW